MNDTSKKLLPTSLVGSYSQPNWLINRDKLAERLPPRTRAIELWRVDPEQLIEAQKSFANPLPKKINQTHLP